ncbi:hypothetical protein M441DRAFT_22177 [Trichoderma asperellum CBS 433.97]|uniref:Uncharacterized protein n=2 Tax=Trichoderma asperellum TaxID=101201 RepID=A0A2T3ZMR9_TRIA4|nr:hypothetical protein M441DRAFT_22177 [Trichoderma asperellum CBS 433.97]PTB46094.1 hypothetical protein M441DRAFT_22177 [Trichoderma asperellum CBS 433.97]
MALTEPQIDIIAKLPLNDPLTTVGTNCAKEKTENSLDLGFNMYNPSGKYQEDVRYENGKALGYEREDMDEDKNVNKYEHEHKHGEGNETKSKDEDEEHFGFYGD